MPFVFYPSWFTFYICSLNRLVRKEGTSYMNNYGDTLCYVYLLVSLFVLLGNSLQVIYMIKILLFLFTWTPINKPSLQSLTVSSVKIDRTRISWLATYNWQPMSTRICSSVCILNINLIQPLQYKYTML